MVQSLRHFLNPEGDSLASMGKPMGKQRVGLTAVDSLAIASKGKSNQKENTKTAKKKVQFSETTSVLASVTNMRRRSKIQKGENQRRSKVSKKIARKPSTDGGVLAAAFTKVSIRSQKKRNEKLALTDEPITAAERGSSLGPPQPSSIEESSSAHDGLLNNHSRTTSDRVSPNDGLAFLFRKSLEISNRVETNKISRARKSKKIDVDRLNLATLMEKLNISSPSHIDRRRRSSVVTKDTSSDMIDVHYDEKHISSPSTASAPKKQDRKKTPKKLSASILSHGTCSNPVVFSIRTTISGSLETDCVHLTKTDVGSVINSVNESGDQNGKQSEPFRRSQRPKKPTNFFQPTVENVVADGETAARNEIQNTEEPMVDIPMSALDHSVSEKTRYGKEIKKLRSAVSSDGDLKSSSNENTLQKASSNEETGAHNGTFVKEESVDDFPKSAFDHNIFKKTRYRKGKTKLRSTVSSDEGLSSSSNTHTIKETSMNPPNIGSLENVEKRAKLSIIAVQEVISPSGSQNSHHLNVGDSNSPAKRPQRSRRPTAFYTPSAKERTSPSISSSKPPSDEAGIDMYPHQAKNDSSRSENQTTLTSRSVSTSEWVEHDSKQGEIFLKCEAVVKTVKSTHERAAPECSSMSSNNERVSRLLSIDQTIGLKSKNEWLPQQLDQLKKAHRKSNPMSGTFWEQVATAVDGKSPGECRDQWYSLIKTPILKSKGAQISCNIAKSSEEDDLFDSTPMRNALDPKKMKSSLLNVYAGIHIANRKVPVSNGEDVDRNKDFHDLSCLQPKIGYKTYLQGMKRDISKEAKTQKKSRKAGRTKGQGKSLRAISGSIKDSEVDMSARLTPGGSFRFLNRNNDDHEDDYEWDDQLSCDS